MDDPPKKGTYSRERLPVARSYRMPRSRRAMILAGGIGALFLGGAVLVSLLFRSGEFVAGGPVASVHAPFETECARCHRTISARSGLRTGAVEDDRCLECHRGPESPVGMYSFDRHYLYAAPDTAGLGKRTAEHRNRETECASCHPEHGGREARLVESPDGACRACHDFRSFAHGHPEFDAALAPASDDSTLLFTHTHHAKILLDAYALTDPCQYCHQLDPQKRGFLPIRFEPHCGACHLTGGEGTGLLPTAGAAGPDRPGVATLESIRAGGEPGTYWAQSANANEYSALGAGLIRKFPVVHADPWILQNLRSLRGRLYGDPGMAGLLDTYGLASNESPALLYAEALSRLEEHVDALEARREQAVRQELSSLRNNLNRARRKTAGEGPFLSAEPFRTPFQASNLRLAEPLRSEAFALADSLTSSCRLCHRVENASIARVQKTQRALLRARFDHGPHLLDMACVDCHSRIPLELEDIAGYTKAFPRALEREAVQNLPGREKCLDCHRPGKAAAACTTCHDFHPGKPGTGLVGGS